MIGDPASRYREDPVRMLRTARFAAKTGFAIEEATRAPIRELAPLIHNVPAARLFDEMLKLLQSGHALESLRSCADEGLHHGLLPLLDVILEQPDGERFVKVALGAPTNGCSTASRSRPASCSRRCSGSEPGRSASTHRRGRRGHCGPARHAAFAQLLPVSHGTRRQSQSA
jgi:tRNA nucleotidyltransferase/poly(A) polymerase